MTEEMDMTEENAKVKIKTDRELGSKPGYVCGYIKSYGTTLAAHVFDPEDIAKAAYDAHKEAFEYSTFFYQTAASDDGFVFWFAATSFSLQDFGRLHRCRVYYTFRDNMELRFEESPVSFSMFYETAAAFAGTLNAVTMAQMRTRLQTRGGQPGYMPSEWRLYREHMMLAEEFMRNRHGG